MKSRFVVVMALAAMLLCSSVSFGATYSDVVTALQTEIPGVVPEEMTFNATCLFHQDSFVQSDLIRRASDNGIWTPADGVDFIDPTGTSAFGGGVGGYIVVNNPDYSNGAGVDDRVVSYGAGNIAREDLAYKVGASVGEFDVTSRLKVAYGNLATKAEIALFGDVATYGYAVAQDTQTGGYSIIPSVRIDDTNADGMIEFDTIYDFNVDEGSANAYFDRNRDGVVDVNDRAFMVVYEGTERVPLDQPRPVTDYWVGNPYSPDALSLPEISETTGFGDPLVVGYLQDVKANTTINLLGNTDVQDQQLEFVLTGLYNLSVVDGRLLDYFDTMSALGYTLTGTWNYNNTFSLGSPDLTQYMEFRGGGPTNLYAQENPVSEPSAALLLLGSLAGVAVRKRRR